MTYWGTGLKWLHSVINSTVTTEEFNKSYYSLINVELDVKEKIHLQKHIMFYFVMFNEGFMSLLVFFFHQITYVSQNASEDVLLSA